MNRIFFLKRSALWGCAWFVLSITWGLAAPASLQPAPIFGSGMVLQQGKPIKVWGTAAASTDIKVSLAGAELKTTADPAGKWAVTFPARKSSFDPVTLQINDISYDDILIGEVWICSGQSNMGFALGKVDGSKRLQTENGALRLCLNRALPNVAKRGYSEEQLKRCNTRDFFEPQWSRSTPKSAMPFSGVAWVFGARLQKELNVPVGLIQIAVGGSAMNSWLPAKVAREHPVTKEFYTKDWLTNEDVFVNHRTRGRDAFQRVLKKGEPYLVGQTKYRWMCEPDFLFEAGISPLKGLNFQGVLWYQGEAETNSEKAVQNAAKLFPAMIGAWREHLGIGDFPFVFVQLPGYGRETWPAFREVQRQVDQSVSNTSMIVSIDLGSKKNIHPKDKVPIGERGAKLVLKDVYDREGGFAFPELVAIQANGGELTLSFKHCGSGFKAVDGDITGFEVAGKDGRFVDGKAQLKEGNVIVLNSPVSTPEQVRYAWQAYPGPKLQLTSEQAGWPLGPFVENVRSSAEAQ